MWIYEHLDWFDFSWDTDNLLPLVADIRYRQGILLGRMRSLGVSLQTEASLHTLTSDTVKSSAIEGEHLDTQEVRSSIARRLGIDIGGITPTNRDVDGIVELMLDATQHYDMPLTTNRLFGWHSALFPTGRSGMHKITVGNWRQPSTDPMQVVSGSIGNQKIHFQAPNAEVLDAEMQTFLHWVNMDTPIDPIIKAGVAHLWFLTLHPFEDGNGRLARAISDMLLARADGTAHRFYSMSTQIQLERKTYYEQLEKQQRGTPDITQWIGWYLHCLGRAIDSAEHTLSNVIFKSQVWDMLQDKPVNERQRLIINRMLEDGFKGYMNTSKYAKMAKCSTDTALRDIKILQTWGIFLQNNSGGRSTSYRIKNF